MAANQPIPTQEPASNITQDGPRTTRQVVTVKIETDDGAVRTYEFTPLNTDLYYMTGDQYYRFLASGFGDVTYDESSVPTLPEPAHTLEQGHQGSGGAAGG